MNALYLAVLLFWMVGPYFTSQALFVAMTEAAGQIWQVAVSESLDSVSESQRLGYFGLGLLMVGLFLLPQYWRRHDRKTILLSPFALWVLTVVHAVGFVVWLVYFLPFAEKFRLVE